MRLHTYRSLGQAFVYSYAPIVYKCIVIDNCYYQLLTVCVREGSGIMIKTISDYCKEKFGTKVYRLALRLQEPPVPTVTERLGWVAVVFALKKDRESLQ